RAALAALREFYDWAGRTQLLELQDPSLACQGPLLDQLDRLAGAGLALSGERASTRRPALFEVEEVAATGFGVRDDDGGGQWLDAAPATSALLRVGDLVLGALVPGAPGDARFEGPVVVLPAEARALIE
ncbi:MAG: hypothetical protein KDE27_24930, partial [Planctomycetes bacterium]|nr:hypothetical protein [Planctomycetota bacterium]